MTVGKTCKMGWKLPLNYGSGLLPWQTSSYIYRSVSHSRVYKYQSELWGTPREAEVRVTHCLNYMPFSKWEGQSTDQWLRRAGGRGENDYKGNGRIWGGDRTWLWGWFKRMYLSKHKEL